jgi:hypothetical protein
MLLVSIILLLVWLWADLAIHFASQDSAKLRLACAEGLFFFEMYLLSCPFAEPFLVFHHELSEIGHFGLCLPNAFLSGLHA